MAGGSLRGVVEHHCRRQQTTRTASWPLSWCAFTLQIDPTVSRVPVPDERFDHLVEKYKPKSVVPAVLTVTDIAGLVKGAAEGAGLGNAFLSHISAVDGIFHVCRAFDNDDIIHVEGSVDPCRCVCAGKFWRGCAASAWWQLRGGARWDPALPAAVGISSSSSRKHARSWRRLVPPPADSAAGDGLRTGARHAVVAAPLLFSPGAAATWTSSTTS